MGKFTKDGASAEEWRQVDAQCRERALAATAGQASVVAIDHHNKLYNACMEGRGWTASR